MSVDIDKKIKLRAGFLDRGSVNIEDIVVKPYLSLAEQVYLIREYVSEYFSELKEEDMFSGLKWKTLSAETNHRNLILQLVTNIDTTDLSDDIYVMENFWTTIFNGKIKNYWKFRDYLDTTLRDIKDIKKMEASVGYVLESMIEKITPILEVIANLDVEQLSNLKDQGKDLLQKVNDTSIIKDMSRTTPEKE